ncbi:predicted protein [Verticillium alfalfae VaMs.102]|uniref:Predicted protein n=1 Tax=Verticillium alfalfae (strain VaMs.102 / ATCC MYA-4576 / FGSC 10136) TaxID=526221 RepID=C9SEE7_VERA1|nr:predicted protein [Verticillium alfalfae VaMs.102]EEY16540.1 predicted protein [Verticillium alfalfae VaMs.102]
MDIFNSDFYAGLDLQAAQDYSRASEPTVPDTLGLRDVMLEGPLNMPIDPALSDPTAIDYSGIVSDLFDDMEASLTAATRTHARCPDRGTRQCRFNDCPAPSRSILKGWWRVAFDEHPEATGSELDPFHCAGFMHLFCFEKCFDLVEMMNAFDVRPDTRQFEREQKNFMALTRDHVEILADLGRWRVEQEHKWQKWQDKLAASGESGLSRPVHPQDHLCTQRRRPRPPQCGEAKAALAEKMMRERTHTSSKRKRAVDDDGDDDEDASNADDADADSDESYDRKPTGTQNVKAALAKKMLRERTRTSSKRKRDDDDDEGGIDADDADADVNPDYDGKVTSIQKAKPRAVKRPVKAHPNIGCTVRCCQPQSGIARHPSKPAGAIR